MDGRREREEGMDSRRERGRRGVDGLDGGKEERRGWMAGGREGGTEERRGCREGGEEVWIHCVDVLTLRGPTESQVI